MLAPLVQLGDVVNLIGGGTPSKSNEGFYGGDIPWATVRDMKQEQLSETELQISEEAVKKSSTNIIEAGNIITATRVGLGKVCILQQDTAINQDLKALIPKDGRLDKQYLFWWLKSVAHVIEAAGTGATVKGVKIPFVKALEIPLPSITEQKRIVAILDQAFSDINKARALAEQNLKNARELFEGYLQKVFSQRGEGWVNKRLNEICAFSSGGTPSKKKNSYWEGNIPWVSGRDMKSTKLTDSLLHITQAAVDESSTRMAPAGAILILVRGMGLAHGAQVAELLVPCAFNQDIRGLHPESGIVPSFLVFALRHRINASDNILSNAAHGTLKINMDGLKNIVIAMPPEEQQKEIVERIDLLIEQRNQLELIYKKKLGSLDELKKSLLQKAFAGKLTKDSGEAAA